MSKTAFVCLTALLLFGGTAFPQTDEWHALMQQGTALEAAADFAGAVTYYERAARIGEPAAAGDTRTMRSWAAAAAMHDALGRYSDAVRSYRLALAGAEQSRGRNSEDYAVLLGSLGSLYTEMGQVARGTSMLRESIATQEALKSADESRLTTARICLAEALASAGQYPEAEQLLTAGLAVWEKHADAWKERSLVLNNLGIVQLRQQRYAEAQRSFERSLALMEAGLSPDHPMLVRVLGNLAVLFGRTGRRAEAMQIFSRALGIVDRYLGPDHPVNGPLLRNYAAVLRQSGDKAGARRMEARSALALKQSALRNGAGMVVDISELARK